MVACFLPPGFVFGDDGGKGACPDRGRIGKKAHALCRTFGFAFQGASFCALQFAASRRKALLLPGQIVKGDKAHHRRAHRPAKDEGATRAHAAAPALG